MAKDKHSIFLETNLQSCPGKICLVYNNKIKSISCDENLEIEDKGGHIYISATRLMTRLEALEKRLSLLEKI